MKRWYRLLDGWLIAAALFLAVLVALLGCVQPVKLPVVIPAKVVPRPVCTDKAGNMGWIVDLAISGGYLVREFYASGGYADVSSVIHPAPWPAVNQVYVIEDHLPWRLVYRDTRGGKHYVSDLVTAQPPPCVI